MRTILNLNRTKSLWSLDPRSENPKNLFNEGATEAVGNQVSAEFNLVYRWHSCISLRDQKWSEDLFAQMFPDKDSTKVDVEEFIHAMRQWEESLPQYPSERSFARLQRTSEGKYNDDDLAAIFTESVEDCAGAFGANQVPIVLRAVEIMGIQQARSWNLASLNEFRRHFNLAPHKTFEDINPDPLVAEKLKVLYDHPDFVELYPGLVIEEAKEAFTPGSGLCANFTITRAILSDAVALVRGDRFYTIDYTPKQLTNWGFSLVDYDLSVDYGCVFHKLVLHALPHNYRQDSIYAHYPLVTPSENHGILTELGLAEDYSFSKPASIPKFVSISSYVACKSTLENKVDFRSISDEAVASLRRDGGLCTPEGLDFMQPGGGLGSGNSRRLMEAALYTAHWKQETKNFYEHITLTLLHRNTHTIAGVNQVDMVRDVLNPAQVHFASSVFSLPLKTDDNPHGLFTENELYPLMVIIFTSIFYDVDPARSFPLKHAARKVMRRLGELKGSTACGPAKTSLLSNLLEMFFYRSTVSNYGIRMIRRLLGSGTDPEKLDWTHFLTAAAAMVANHSQLSSQCLDFYLSDEGRLHLPEIKRLAKENTAEADDILLR